MFNEFLREGEITNRFQHVEVFEWFVENEELLHNKLFNSSSPNPHSRLIWSLLIFLFSKLNSLVKGGENSSAIEEVKQISLDESHRISGVTFFTCFQQSKLHWDCMTEHNEYLEDDKVKLIVMFFNKFIENQSWKLLITSIKLLCKNQL